MFTRKSPKYEFQDNVHVHILCYSGIKGSILYTDYVAISFFSVTIILIIIEVIDYF